jgi:hypothetical protein
MSEKQAGRLSVNAAAAKAGWRPKPTTLEQIRKLWAKLDPAEQQSFCNDRCPRR